MSEVRACLELHEFDQLLREAVDTERATRLRALGFAIEAPATLLRERERLAERLDRRWLNAYERAYARYGRGLWTVRQRVCQACRLTLPTSAAPPAGEVHLHLCEGCGRLLLWE